MHRGTADRDALKACTEIVSGGSPLVMFPEGTRQSGPDVQELFDGMHFAGDFGAEHQRQRSEQHHGSSPADHGATSSGVRRAWKDGIMPPRPPLIVWRIASWLPP